MVTVQNGHHVPHSINSKACGLLRRHPQTHTELAVVTVFFIQIPMCLLQISIGASVKCSHWAIWPVALALLFTYHAYSVCVCV